MGVFLRWGIFGIIAVAALVYAYNALGRLAERHKAAPVAAATPAPVGAGVSAGESPESPGSRATPPPQVEHDAIPERCEVELDIARRAAESRSIGEPLDRLLRIQEIAWQKDETLRERYTQLATRWYDEPGPVDAGRLRRDVLAACVNATP